MAERKSLLNKAFFAAKKIESLSWFSAIQQGMVMIIPLLLIGSFALIAKSLPLTVYQDFLKTTIGIYIYNFFNIIYQATFGMLSVYMTLAIGYCVGTGSNAKFEYVLGTTFSSLICFVITTGAMTNGFNSDYFGVNGMFPAILSGIFASKIYLRLANLRFGLRKLHNEGTDYFYDSAMKAIFPMVGAILAFMILHFSITVLINVACIQELFVIALNRLFDHISSDFSQGFVFILMSSLLWFFGIHGSDALNCVNDGIFAKYIEENSVAAAAGNAAPHIVSKTFIDTFVLMGGCGAALCLLAAILIFGRIKMTRRLAKTALLPIVFNVNEPMVFGLPIIYNPILFVPFIITPVAAFLISYSAVALGIVPAAVHTVEWTTPVFFSGYNATGSIAGSILQLFNFVIGIGIYAPFVRLLEKDKTDNSKNSMEEIISKLKKAEKSGSEITLNKLRGGNYAVVKMLTADLRHAITAQRIEVHYQP